MLENIKLRPISERKNKISIQDFKDPGKEKKIIKNTNLERLGDSIKLSRKNNKEVILMMGAHPIKLGLSLYLIELMKKGFITYLAMNGATSIHDFEIAMIGATSEYVEENIIEGKFGMWEETASINNIINTTIEGYGKAIGKNILENNFKYKDYSLLGNAYKLNIPATVHIAIGTDINQQYKNFNPEKAAKASYEDLSIFMNGISKLEGGVIINLGSAVMMPEIFQKRLNLVRNLGYKVENFTAANLDMINHYRPRVNVLERTTKGKKLNIIERHEDSIPSLYYLLTK